MKYLLPIFFLVSCYTTEKAERQVNRAYIEHQDLLRAKLQWWWPCLPYERKTDSVKYVAFLRQIDTLLEVKRDTIIDTIKLDKICPERKILIKYKDLLKYVPPIHDTIKIKDMSCESIKADLSAQNSKLKDSNAKGQKWIISLLIALCVSIILHLIRKR
jgi:hypothetical protein